MCKCWLIFLQHLTLESASPPRPSKPVKQMVMVMELPWSVFHKICVRLMVPSVIGRDWKGLAGLYIIHIACFGFL